jgi:adenine/guanine phosphoribosyltransferase-like PRPP-binding protein
VEGIGGTVAGCLFAVELSFLKGREKLAEWPTHAVMTVG